ncbi:hypothetical protein FGB62_27g27 [Gracilaria domingensis]|nr:hypothetical protein FGB62_27g27 [Gracilaria domingensis]
MVNDRITPPVLRPRKPGSQPSRVPQPPRTRNNSELGSGTVPQTTNIGISGSQSDRTSTNESPNMVDTFSPSVNATNRLPFPPLGSIVTLPTQKPTAANGSFEQHLNIHNDYERGLWDVIRSY